MEEIVKFAHKENLIIIADEVYQNNVLKEDCNFVSFKRVSYLHCIILYTATFSFI